MLAWLRARSIARTLPQPVADRGGWRVDTRSEAEWCRHVYVQASEDFRAIALEIDRPRVFLKLCTSEKEMRAMLPDRWEIGTPSYVMTGPEDVAARILPDGYAAMLNAGGAAVRAEIRSADGTLAASGYAAECDGVYVYDRIVTDPRYQRRGLGGAVMALLGSQRRSRESRQVLVATAQGRALYDTLGWRFHAPYATAVIPDSPV